MNEQNLTKLSFLLLRQFLGVAAGLSSTDLSTDFVHKTVLSGCLFTDIEWRCLSR
jgi:hypothetical protein